MRYRALPAPAAASATAARPTIGFGSRFVDVQGPAVQVAAVQFRDGAVGIRIRAHLDETETAGLAGIAVGNDAYLFDGPVSLKQGSDGVFGCPKVEVPHKDILHSIFLSELRV